MYRLDGKLISGMFQVCRDAHNENRNTNDSCGTDKTFPCTLFGLQGYCAKVVAFKTLSNINVIEMSLTR